MRVYSAESELEVVHVANNVGTENDFSLDEAIYRFVHQTYSKIDVHHSS
jgi:hypothetical protein